MSTTSFGELRTESAIPVIQLNWVYGLDELVVDKTERSPATATASDSMLVLTSGTTIGALARIETKTAVRYRPGEGILVRFTALWTGCSTNQESYIGYGDIENGLFVACQNGNYGILHRSGGRREIYTVTITGAATADGSYTIELDGTSVEVADISNGDSVEVIAAKIAADTGFAAAGNGWEAHAVGAVVVLEYTDIGDLTGTFSVTDDMTGTSGAGVSTDGATYVTDDFVTAFNLDPLDGTGSSGTTIDWSKGNVFQIQVQWLGFGAITFSVETGSGYFTPVHRIHYANLNTAPSLKQPSNPVSASITNTGTATSYQLKAACFSAFVEGSIQYLHPPFSASSTLADPGSSVVHEVVALQANRQFNGVHSHIKTHVMRVTMSYLGATSQECTFTIVKNPTVDSYNYRFAAVTDSGISLSTSTAIATGTEVSGGTTLYAAVVGGQTSVTERFEYEDIVLNKGDIVVIGATCTAANSATATVLWKEDR